MLARVLLTRIWLSLVRLLAWTGPALARSGLPGPCVPHTLAELLLAGCPARPGRLTRRLPRAGVAVARSACGGRPALPLLGSLGLPGTGVPRVSAVPWARRLPAAGVARTWAVRSLRRPGGLPRPGGPDIWSLTRPLASAPARRLLWPSGLPGPCVSRVLAILPGRLRTAILSGPVGIRHVRLLPIRSLTVGSLPAWPRSLPRPGLRRTRPGRELALVVAGWPRGLLPVSLLALWWPRLPGTLGACLTWNWSLPGTCPAWPVLASPRLLRRELSLAARTRTGRYRPRPLLNGREALRGPWSAWCLAAEVLSLVSRTLLVRRMSLPLIPRLPLPRVARPRRGGAWAGGCGRSRSWRVGIRPRAVRVGGPRGPRAARRRGTLLPWPGARATRPRTRASGTRPRTAYARHRVVGTLPGPVSRRGVIRRLPASAASVAGPGRHAAALRTAWRWTGWHVCGAGPVGRETLVAGVNGVGVGLQVSIPLVGVALRIGSVAGPAVRASVRPAALTTHPVPPSVRRSLPPS